MRRTGGCCEGQSWPAPLDPARPTVGPHAYDRLAADATGAGAASISLSAAALAAAQGRREVAAPAGYVRPPHEGHTGCGAMTAGLPAAATTNGGECAGSRLKRTPHLGTGWGCSGPGRGLGSVRCCTGHSPKRGAGGRQNRATAAAPNFMIRTLLKCRYGWRSLSRGW